MSTHTKNAGLKAGVFSLIALALCSCLLGACAANRAFGPAFPDNREADIGSVLARAKAAKRGVRKPVVVGVNKAPREVFAYDLERDKMLWKVAESPVSTPLVAGDYVVVPEGERVVVHDLQTGEKRFELKNDGMGLMGADGDDQLAAFVLSTGGTMGARSKLVVVRNGSVKLKEDVKVPLGGPAVLGGLIFLPWNRIYLSALDETGKELARVRVTDDVVSQALARDGEVYFGEAGVFKLDERAASGSSQSASYFRSTRKSRLPGNPAFLTPASTPPAAVDSAVHRVSLRFSPEADGSDVRLSNNNLYLTFYKQIYALDPSSEGVRWVSQTESDIAGTEAVPGGFLALDESGKLSYFDASGVLAHTASLDVKPIVAHFRVDHYARTNGQGTEPNPLTMQLVEAALNPDNRLVPARAMAVTLLAGLEEEDATGALVDICQDRTTPDKVRKVACVELAQRTTGSEPIIAALSRHADYLTDTKAPPVGPLAEAAAKTRDGRAVPLLLAHLADPNTPADELPALMVALKTLADAKAAEPVSDFLRLYHADADEQHMQDALNIAVQVLAKLKGQEATSVLEPIANDSLSTPTVRAEAARALAMLAPNEPPEKTAAKETKPAIKEAPVDAGPPERLNIEHLRKALFPVQEKLAQCVRNDAKRPASARVTIVIDGQTGAAIKVQTLPESVQACITPLVMAASFPTTSRGLKETLTYQVSR